MAVLGFLISFIVLFLAYSAVSTANQKVVVIQPGHSLGYDSGATSAYKSEAQLNQELAGRVVRILNDRGYKVYITHTTDAELQGQKLISQEEGSHLANVGAAVNSVNPDLALSLHHNSGGTSSSGYELYWSSYRNYDQSGIYTAPNMWSDGSGALRDSTPSPEAQASKTLAEAIKNHMNGIPNLAFRNIYERDDYLPAHAHCPCILYEGGFLSNPNEAAYLASEQYVSEASRRIADAVDEFLGGSGSTAPSAPSQSVTQAPAVDSQRPIINSVSSSATQTGSTTFTISCNVSDDSGIKAVHFASWTEAGGQDDLLWKDGKDNGGGNWSCVIDIGEHGGQTGRYITHVYAEDGGGNQTGVEAPVVEVTSSNILSGEVVASRTGPTQAIAYSHKTGYSAILFAVWSEKDGQDDLIWAEGTPQADGSSKYVINLSDHANCKGTYQVHSYTKNGMNFIGQTTVEFGVVRAQDVSAVAEGNQIQMKVTGLEAPDGVSKVYFAVYPSDVGSSAVEWIQANVDSSGNYYASAVKDSKNYVVDVYVVDPAGNYTGLAERFVDLAGTSQQAPAAVNVSISPQTGSSFTVTASGVPQGISILVPVWSEAGGQDDLVWYEATRNAEGNYVLSFDINNHSGGGLYNVHVYTSDSAGNLSCVFVGTASATAQSGAVTKDTPIMGSSGTSATQLINFYNKQNPNGFPEYYTARGVGLGDLVQMYIDECAAENVRVDLAFCQAMLETGFLRFGGDVQISQFNFAGLGATGGGVRGEDFSSYGDNANGIRVGVRAQIQHLKAYASTDPLNQTCVDNRFGYVTRGSVTTIGGLSGKWAADTTYADKIVNYINQLV